MRKILTIAEKELAQYFYSPMAYILLVIIISIFNTFFYLIIDQSREATLRDMFQVMEFMFVFIVPLLTMKTFADETMTGTMEFLMTTPTRNSQIVIGKFLGVLFFLTLIILLSGAYFVILEYFTDIDQPEALSGYLGIWLEGALFVAVGVMCSSWTKNATVAAICAYAMIFLSYFSISFIKYIPAWAEEPVRYFGTWSHLENFSSGIIYFHDIVYYVSGIMFCVLITRLSIEQRLWR